jgi:hypothetical protein
MRWLRALTMLGLCAVGCGGWLDTAVAQGMIVAIPFAGDNPEPRKPTAPINNLRELSAALARCWNPPPIGRTSAPLDLNFTVSFKRSGELFGKPRAVIFARPVTDEERQIYYVAVAEAVTLCSQMPFTDSMGGAVAGRTFQIRFIDMRNRKQALWLRTRTF